MNKHTARKRLALLALTGLLAAPQLHAQTFATKPIRIITPFALGGAPPTIVKQWYDAIKVASGTPAFRQRASSEGLIVTLATSEAAAAFVLAEEAKWRRTVKEQPISAD